jgi:hypothetical protein
MQRWMRGKRRVPLAGSREERPLFSVRGGWSGGRGSLSVFAVPGYDETRADLSHVMTFVDSFKAVVGDSTTSFFLSIGRKCLVPASEPDPGASAGIAATIVAALRRRQVGIGLSGAACGRCPGRNAVCGF